MKKSIAKVGYAPITWDDKTKEYTYGAIKYFESEKSGGRSYEATPRGEETTIYADGMAVFAVNENDGYDLKLQLLDIVDDIDKDWLGNEVSDEGIAEYATGNSMPKFALVLVNTDTAGKYVTEFYYQTEVVERPSKSGKTSEGKFEAAFFDVTLKCLPREHDEPTKRLVTYQYRSDKIPEGIKLPAAAASAGVSES